MYIHIHIHIHIHDTPVTRIFTEHVGPFALLLCVGKFYASPKELETTNEVLSNLPIDTYILPPAFHLDHSHLPPNIHLLRPSGTQQIQGITIGTCAEGDIYPAEDLTRMKDTHFKGTVDMHIHTDSFIHT